jgi:hypothetical protein
VVNTTANGSMMATKSSAKALEVFLPSGAANDSKRK